MCQFRLPLGAIALPHRQKRILTVAIQLERAVFYNTGEQSRRFGGSFKIKTQLILEGLYYCRTFQKSC